jgi:hypothetical protein
VRKYHPGIDNCNEEAMKGYARELYPNICNPEHGPLLMGVPCDEVMEELKKTYPGVIDTTETSRPSYATGCECNEGCTFCGHFNESCFCSDANIPITPREGFPDLATYVANSTDDRACLAWFCEPSIPGIDCEDVEDIFWELSVLSDLDFDDYMADIDDEGCDPLPHRVFQGRNSVCITPLCSKTRLSSIECEYLGDLLEWATEDKLSKKVFYTTNEDVCGELI